MSPESLNVPTEEGQTVADELRKRLNLLIVMQVVMTLALGGTVLYFAVQAGKTHDALCNLRADQVARIRTSQEFLTEHPHGAGGISRKIIIQGIDQATKVVASLDGLGCPSVPVALVPGKETP